MLLDKLKPNNLTPFLLFLSLAYCYGVLSASHYGMYGNDFYLSLAVTSLASIGSLFGLHAINIERIGISTLTWLAFAIFILLQPIFHTVHYADGLIFPFGILVLSAIVSILAINIPKDRFKHLSKCIAWMFLATGMLSVCTQLLQLFYPNSFDEFIAPLSSINRLYGNIAQPNTASFINVLAITSCFYLYHLNKSKKTLMLMAGCFAFLVAGIALTLSRAGLLMLAVAIVAMLFYPWRSHQTRFGLLAASTLLSIIAYQVGMWLMQSFSAIYEGSSGVERLITEGAGLRPILLERAWSAFSSNPIFGVGYDHFYSHSVKRIENYAWFETADHSHNILAQIGAEFGLIGLLASMGVIIVLLRQLVLFFKSQLSSDRFFICLLLLIFVLYSFSEFPLWYPKFLLPFAFLVGLLDKGVPLKQFNPKKPLAITTFVLSLCSITYTGLYSNYLLYYEIVVFAPVDNQKKIDAYHAFPNIFGFSKSKDYMLHMVADVENPDNIEHLITLGNRLMETIPGMDIARVHTQLLMNIDEREEADMLNRRLCVWENQQTKHCNRINEQIRKIDPNDEMGYAKRLNDWYQTWLASREK